jgi:hypothetical protein
MFTLETLELPVESQASLAVRTAPRVRTAQTTCALHDVAPKPAPTVLKQPTASVSYPYGQPCPSVHRLIIVVRTHRRWPRRHEPVAWPPHLARLEQSTKRTTHLTPNSRPMVAFLDRSLAMRGAPTHGVHDETAQRDQVWHKPPPCKLRIVGGSGSSANAVVQYDHQSGWGLERPSRATSPLSVQNIFAAIGSEALLLIRGWSAPL